MFGTHELDVGFSVACCCFMSDCSKTDGGVDESFAVVPDVREADGEVGPLSPKGLFWVVKL
jgi:hypothetical protein